MSACKKTKMKEDHSKKPVRYLTDNGRRLRTLLGQTGPGVLASLNPLAAATQLVSAMPPDIINCGQRFRNAIRPKWDSRLGLTDTKLLIAVWGVSMAEGEALWLLQAGERAVFAKRRIWTKIF